MIPANKNGISYLLDTSNFTAQIVSSSNAKGSLFIPRSINYQSNEYTILKISENSFEQNRNIKSIEFSEDSALQIIEKNAFSKSSLINISLPSSVEELQEGWCKHTSSLTTVSVSPNNKNFKYIGEKIIIGKSDKNSEKFDVLVFGLRSIQSVEIPSYIKQISSYAFSECNSLSSVIFSENSELLLIGKDAFSYTSIKSLSIPPSIEELKEGWCRKTPKLTHVSIPSENKNFSLIDEKFIVGKSNKNDDKFDVLLFANRDIEKAEIPSYIKQIHSFAFCQCKNLSEIKFSEDSELQIIHKNAFCYSSIKSLNIPPKVDELKDGWCKNILKLNHVSVSPKNKCYSCIDNKFIFAKSDVKSDDFDLLVFGCRSIEKVNILKNVKRIGHFAFSYCKNLQVVEFEDGSQLQSIGKDGFSKSSIEKIILPSKVKLIDARSFYRCERLKFIQFSENSELEIIERKAFALTPIKKVSIPSKVHQIGEKAFQECENLKFVEFPKDSELKSIEKLTFSFAWIENIKIPANVRKICERAFSYCKNLQTIEIPENSQLEVIEKNAFFNSAVEKINFPSKLKELREGWCSYTSKLTQISISSDNPYFKYVDNKFIVGKINENESEYENLLFVRRDVHEITIPKYIKRIESRAFSQCKNIKTIGIPNDSQLESIGFESFSYSSLEEISIPIQVNEIEERAFYWCRELQNVHFPEFSQMKVFNKEIIFYTPIKELFIPSGIEKMNKGWCDFITQLNKVTVSPDNKHFACINEKLIVGKSDENSDEYDILIFACRDIEEVVIPSSIKQLGPFSLSGCKKLRSIEFEEGSKLQTIDQEAFSYSSLIDIINIPSSVTEIGDSSFYKCPNLSLVSFSEDSELCTIGKDAFAYTSIESLFIPAGVKVIKEGWCSHTPKLTNIKISERNKYFSYLDNQIIISRNNEKQNYYDNIIFARRDITEVEIPNYIRTIKSYSFCECYKLKRIQITKESSLEIIEEGAFIKTSIEELYLPSKLKELKDGWCKHTSKLQRITISPNNEHFILHSNEYLIKRYDENDDEYDYLIFANRTIKESTIPNFIKRLGPYSFTWCKNLRTINFEENSKLCSIERCAFSKSSINNIIIPENTKQIDERAFYKCENIKSVQFSENSQLNSIEKEAFAQSSIESISIPYQVHQIGERAFQDCENLKFVEFPEDSELKSIDKYALSFTWVENIKIPANVREIGERAFSYCKNLKKIEIPENSKLKIIEKNAFFNSTIEEINFPSRLKDLKDGWCSYTNKLTHIEISPNNPYLKYVDNKFIASKTDECEYDTLLFARRDITEIMIPKYIKQIGSYAFYECENLKKVEIEEDSKLEIIGKEAFSGTSIETLKIPSSVREIGDRAFYWCRRLKTIELAEDSKLRVFNKEIFFYSSIERLYIPPSIEEMKSGWCDFTWRLKYISISPKNKNFKYIDDKIIVGKTDKDSDVYDILIFARRDIDQISIPSYIKTIGSYAFYWCSYLKSISFSEFSKLTSIEKSAFSFTSFNTIVIPKHVKKIGERAFYRSDRLKSVVLSEDSELCTIGKDAFAYTSIESLFIPAGVKVIKEGWCSHTPKLTNIKISEQNKYFSYIDNQMIISRNNEKQNYYDNIIFARRDITEVEIPNYIRTIKSYSFCECCKLKRIQITKESSLETIEEGAFIKTSIEELYFPSKLKELKDGWCKHTSKLQRITISPNNEHFILHSNEYLIKRYDENDDEYDYLIFANRNIKEATIPNFIKRLGPYSFTWCKNLQTINFEENSKLCFIGKDCFSKSSFEKIAIPSSVEKIGDRSFFKCNNLNFVQFSDDSKLKLIDKKAFSFTPIKHISIPSKVQLIGERSFYSCKNLESVTFSNDSELVNIDKSAFSLSAIKKISIPSNVNQISKQAFFKCEYLQSVEFSENSKLHLIEQKAFSKTSIESISIPSQLEEIKEGWCCRSPKISSISVSKDNKYFSLIDDKLLVKKSEINSNEYDTLVFVVKDIDIVEIPSNIKCISSFAFSGCNNLKSVVFSEDSKLQTIDKKAFSKSSIHEISIPSNVKYIFESAFYRCQNLKSIEFLENLQLCSIDFQVFAETNIENIKIPANVKEIEERAFSYCQKLKKVEIPENSKLEMIEKNAFYNSTIEEINFPSKLKELKDGWCSFIKNLTHISISSNNQYLKFIDSKFIVSKTDQNENENKGKEEEEYDTLLFALRDVTEIMIPKYIKKIESYAFYECKNLEKVEIEEDSKLEIIGKEAFSGTSIETLKIPSSVREIGDRAFYWCRRLKTIELAEDSKLRVFNKEIFFYSSIERLYIPPSIEEMKSGWNSFTLQLNNITVSPESTHFLMIDDKLLIGKLSENSHEFDVLVFASRDIFRVFIPSFIKQIGPLAFSWCKNLDSIDFANGSKLQLIDEEAFSYSSLRKISIPNGVDQICYEAFASCEFLRSIEFPEDSKLTSIDKNILSKSSIKSITIPSSVVRMEDGWCSKLKNLTKVSISNENPNFSVYDNDFIISKSDENNEEFDVLIFARRDIENAVIPPFIKRITSFSFSECQKLKSIEFSEDSQIKSIDKNAFLNSSLRRISFPASLDELVEGWCNGVSKLNQIEISPENKRFSLINDQIIVGKSKNSEEFNVLHFACRGIRKVCIPSSIEQIDSFAFCKCNSLKFVDFESDSKLTTINKNTFSSSSLLSVSIPNNTQFIKQEAFIECIHLEVVEFLGEKIYINGNCFCESNSFAFIACPNAVKVEIDQDALNNLSSEFKLYVKTGAKVV